MKNFFVRHTVAQNLKTHPLNATVVTQNSCPFHQMLHRVVLLRPGWFQNRSRPQRAVAGTVHTVLPGAYLTLERTPGNHFSEY